MATGDTEKALENLEIYNNVASKETLEYLVVMGQAHYYGEEYEEAVNVLTEALEDTYYARELAPEVFRTGMALGKTFFVTEEYRKAKVQLDAQEDRAETDSQLGKVYYWRAGTLEALEEFYLASRIGKLY